MTKINFRSDFDFILQLFDHDGRIIGWPPFDFRVRLWTDTRCRAYEAGVKDGVPFNCYEDDGRIHIVCDNHGLHVGRLHIDFTSLVPDDKYPDANKSVLTHIDTDILLTVADSELPAAGEIEITIPWHMMHDTDVYNSVLEKVNEAMAEILGSGSGSGQPSAASLGSIALRGTKEALYIEGYERYLAAGYAPLLFRYGRFKTTLKKQGKVVDKVRYSGLRCYGQRYNCIIDTATNRVGYVRDFARQQPYAELDASAARFTPADYLSYGEDSSGVPVISHGANSSIEVDEADGYNFEFAFAFVRPDITHDKRITEADCVSNIVPFAVTAYSVDGDTMMTFSTTRPYKRYSVSRNKKVLAEAKD